MFASVRADLSNKKVKTEIVYFDTDMVTVIFTQILT